MTIGNHEKSRSSTAPWGNDESPQVSQERPNRRMGWWPGGALGYPWRKLGLDEEHMVHSVQRQIR